MLQEQNQELREKIVELTTETELERFSVKGTQLYDEQDHLNVMYTYHFYAGVSDCKFAMEEISRGLEQDLPVFISEWGMDSREAAEEHLEETKSFWDFLDEKNISWVNWSLSNKDEEYSLIAPDIDKLYGWETYDLTDTGRFVLPYLSKTKK